MPTFNQPARVMAFVALLASFLPLAPSARADGLLYDLPKDGTWVKYDMTVTMAEGGRVESTTATLTMAVVGTVKEKDTTMRWIEFSMVMKQPGPADPANPRPDRKVTAKVLIPEEHLKKGADPMKNLERGWIMMRENQVKALEQRDYGPVPAFLAGPLTDAKDLKAAEVESKLGKLECAGVRGTVTFEEAPDRKAIVTYQEIRLHKKAPFGVVAMTMQHQTQQSTDPLRDRGTITFKLADLGDDAKTALPDNK